MTHPLMPDVIAVEVPNWAVKHGLDSGVDEPDAGCAYVIIGLPGKYEVVPLPEGNWAYLFCTADASEEQAREIVGEPLAEEDGGEEGYFMWGYSQNQWPYVCDTAKESLQSLLNSKGLKQNYALLKKIN